MDYKSLRILISVLILTFPVLINSIFAQNTTFREGLNYYEDGKYKEAIAIFQTINEPEALLFQGKSYFALGNEIKSISILDKITGDVKRATHDEIKYTRALAHFNLKNFSAALDELHYLKSNAQNATLRVEATRFYKDIINYLTLNQRRHAFNTTNNREIQRDLILMIFDSSDFHTLQSLYTKLLETSTDTVDYNLIIQYQSVLNNKTEFGSFELYPTPAPDGIHYHLGVILPDTTGNNEDIQIPASIFNGILIAADEFNRNNPNRKVFIHHVPSQIDAQNAGQKLSELVWNNRIDAVIGPLFSDEVNQMESLAELYGVPVITPLSNMDDVNKNNPYIFQINPTFSKRGTLMAQFAYNELGHRDFAIISDKGTLGEIEAFSFRSEIERLGGNVVYFFNDDYETAGFNFSHIIPYLQPDTALVDSTINWLPIDAVYAPFTGETASTLLDILLTELEALNLKASVLSSDELGYISHSPERIRRLNLYFSETFYISEADPRVINFRIDYQNRTGTNASLFSFVGYDTTTFLLHVLQRVQNPDYLKSAIIRHPPFRGLSTDIWFNSSNINNQLQIFRITGDGPVLAN